MSASEPPDWEADDTGDVPVGPEPEPTGATASGHGPGGWGGKPRTEPFAVAALVWAVVSIVVPIVATIVAFVLAARAADAIRRSHGRRSGMQLVTAARVTAGAVIALWAIGLVAFVALGGNDGDNNRVAVPTQPSTTTSTVPPSTTSAPTSTTARPSTTAVPQTTTVRPTVVTVSPPRPATAAPTTPPTLAPTTPPTLAPTAPPTTPTTAPNSTTRPAPPSSTTTAPTTTTLDPERGLEVRLERRLGPGNRGVPPANRVSVQYSPGATVVVTWAINNGAAPLPVGQPTCTAAPVSPPSSTSTTTTSTSTPSTTTTSTTTTTLTTTTTMPPPDEATRRLARQEARTILQVVRNDLERHRIDVGILQLVGTYPIEGQGAADVDVVQVVYSKSAIEAPVPSIARMFEAPPATEVQCLNPSFA